MMKNYIRRAKLIKKIKENPLRPDGAWMEMLNDPETELGEVHRIITMFEEEHEDIYDEELFDGGY